MSFLTISKAIDNGNGIEEFQYLTKCITGIAFLGTPHRGSSAIKWAELVAKCSKVLGADAEDEILQGLRENSDTQRDLLYRFSLWSNRNLVEVVCLGSCCSIKKTGKANHVAYR